MLRLVLTAFVLNLAFVAAPRAQQVWPGDVNNNGIVNEVDLLFWGLAHGSTGNARADEGTEWQTYDLPLPWPQNFANGVNFAFADCDGDGTVDESDYDDAIEDNFGLQHQAPTSEGYVNAAAGGNAPRLRLQPSVPVVEEGTELTISLSIDDSMMPLDSFYGIALSLSYTTGLIDDGDGLDFELETNNWIESDNSYVEDIFYENAAQGSASLAITRTNQMAVPAQAGVFGSFSIVIEDIIVGLEVDTFYLQIDSIMLITPGFNTIPVVPDTALVIVAKDLDLLGSDNEELANMVRLYPRPAKDVVYVQTDFPLTKPLLVDQLGRVIPVELLETSLYNYRLNCSRLSSGMYWLRAVTNRGPVTKKIIISN